MTKKLEEMNAEELHAHLQKLVREWNTDLVLKAERDAYHDRFSRRMANQVRIEHEYNKAALKGGEQLQELLNELHPEQFEDVFVD